MASAAARGERIARALAGAWRDPVAPLGAAEVAGEEIVRLTIESGGGGLLWRRLRAGGEELPGVADCYRRQVLDEGMRVKEIGIIINTLRAKGMDPLLLKGWSIARLYPERGMRPYTDIDIAVPEGEVGAAKEALAGLRVGAVDFHAGIPRTAGRSEEEVRARMRRVRLGEVEILVLGAEDQLRFLALHLLAHGAWRTIWLVDLAVALEAEEAGFDWDYFLGGRARDTEAVLSAASLAHAVLGARIEGTPIARRAPRPPAWLERELLAQWGRGFVPHIPLGRLPWRPGELFAEVRRRWPNAIAATETVEGPYNDFPRFPLQVADFGLRTVRYLRGVLGR